MDIEDIDENKLDIYVNNQEDIIKNELIIYLEKKKTYKKVHKNYLFYFKNS
jgi:hypothetical protein